MNEKTLLEAVVLAGELMLVSGAEIYRVEDTMNHMLKRSEYEQTETIVYGTGIFVTLSDPNKEPLTRVKRVADRCTSINRICLVNDVSRHFCEGKITVEDVDVLAYVSWKNGDFIFRNESLNSIMDKLSRWYGLEVLYQDAGLQEVRLSGNLKRYKDVRELFVSFEKIFLIHVFVCP